MHAPKLIYSIRTNYFGFAPDQSLVKHSSKNVEQRLIYFSACVKLLTHGVQTALEIGLGLVCVMGYWLLCGTA